VAEVEVGLRAVVEHIDLAVLIGRHGAGIDVEVGIELLHQHLEAAGFEQRADGCGGEALAE
jgi:hypothetical protein